MDAFASVISNNLNVIMKLLASVTILMTVPNIVFSGAAPPAGTPARPSARSG